MNALQEHTPVVVGYEVLTALGSLDASWQGLMAGRTGLRKIALPHVPNSYPVGQVAGLGNDSGSARRLANLLKMGLGDVFKLPPACKNGDIIVATTKGAADELLADSRDPAAQSWDIGRMVAETAGMTGRRQTISAACASGTVAVIQAAKHITAGRAPCVLVVGIDLLSSFVMAGFDALKGLSTDPCTPFDQERTGLSLGEGMGAVALCSEAFAAANRLKILARLQGWGVSCDATHITAPSRTGSGLLRIIEQATAQGAIKVGAINAHGTGTVYNDAMEMTAFQTFWDDPPPFHSVKGAIGHCLGAAGVIEAAIALRSLAEGFIPPSIGFRQGDAPADKISGTSPLPLGAQTILTCNSGFGGINAGIIFSRP